MRHADAGDRRPGEVPRVDNRKVGRLLRQVDDEADQPALVLRRIRPGGDEDELAGITAGAEVVRLARARLQIVLVEPRRADDVALLEPVRS